jgi:Fe-S-cluster containining protein
VLAAVAKHRIASTTNRCAQAEIRPENFRTCFTFISQTKWSLIDIGLAMALQ